MSSIAQIDLVPFRVPLRGEMRFATGVLTAADHVLVRVTDRDGHVGIAEAIPRPMIYGETTGSILAAYRDVIGPVALGRPPWDIEALHTDLQALLRNETAKAAFELATLDLLGHQLGISVSTLLGGCRSTAQVSAILSTGPPAQVAAEATSYFEDYGITAFKIKIAVGDDLARDVGTCALVREQLGEDALIYVDANHGYDARDASRFCRATQSLDIAWIEEPSPADRIVDRERVAANCGLPVLGDESVVSPGDVAREVSAGRVHMVSLKVSRSGWRDSDRIRGFCDTVGVPMVMGSQGDTGIGTLTALGYAAAFESTSRYAAEYSYFLHMKEDLLQEPLTIEGGALSVPDMPGFGIHVDDKKLERFRTDVGLTLRA